MKREESDRGYQFCNGRSDLRLHNVQGGAQAGSEFVRLKRLSEITLSASVKCVSFVGLRRGLLRKRKLGCLDQTIECGGTVQYP